VPQMRRATVAARRIMVGTTLGDTKMTRQPKRRVAEAAVVYETASTEHRDGNCAPKTGKMRLGPQRRVVLPGALVEHLGLEQDDLIIFFLNDDGTATLKSGLAVAQGMVGIFAHLAPGRSLVDELIAERRREVEAERAAAE